MSQEEVENAVERYATWDNMFQDESFRVDFISY